MVADDGNLAAGAVSKDEERFEALMRREGPRIYTLAVRLTGNAADGQDLASETFIRAFRAFGSFRGDAAFGTWTYRICLNLWKNRLRAQKRRRFWSHFTMGLVDDGEEETSFPEPAAPDPALDAGLEAGERRRRVEEALDRLEPEERAIIVLRETEDKSYEEIAAGLGLALGTVKSRLARARGKLRTLLEPLLKENDMSLDPKDIELLSALLDGAASPREKAAAEALMARDPEARKTFEGLKALRGELGKLTPIAPPDAFYNRVLRDARERPPAPRGFFSYAPFKAAGALAAVALVGIATHDLWRPEARKRAEPPAAPSPLQMFQSRAQARQDQTAPMPMSAPASMAADDAPVDLTEAKKKSDTALAGRKVSVTGGIRMGGAGSAKEAAGNESDDRSLLGESAPRPAAFKDERRADALRSLRKEAPAPLPVLSQGEGPTSGIAGFETAAVRTADEWKALWARHAPGGAAPVLDFSRVMVLAVFAGEKPSGGHFVHIARAVPTGDRLLVFYEISAPPQDGFNITMMTQPHHWIAVPRTDLPVDFVAQ